MRRLCAWPALAASLLISACTLAGDITPPPGSLLPPVSTAPAAAPTPRPTDTGLFEHVQPQVAPAQGIRPEEQPEGFGVIFGSVTNGTAGAAVPEGLSVTLYGFENLSQSVTLTASVDALGVFRFEAVPYTPERRFVASATHAGVIYGSDVVVFETGAAALEAPLTIYETTSSPAAVRVERMHLFFDFSGDLATVGELYIFSNDGDRTFWKPSGTLEFSLPAGAQSLNVQGAQAGVDYFQTGQGLVATSPVRPGSGTAQILYSFSLPYGRQMDFEHSVYYPVSVANVLVPEVGVRVRGPALQDQGVQHIQGAPYHSYLAANLSPGDTLSFRLSGRPATAAAAAGGLATDPTSLAIGAGVLGLTIAGVGYWWLLRSRGRSPALPADRESLLQAIADLDDAFEAGEMDERAYRRKRARLKAQLAEWFQ